METVVIIVIIQLEVIGAHVDKATSSIITSIAATILMNVKDKDHVNKFVLIQQDLIIVNVDQVLNSISTIHRVT